MVLSDEKRRKDHILHFEELVCARPDVEDPRPEWEILGNLVMDLAYYVQNPKLRRESPSYFGDEELEAIVHKAFSDLETLGFPTKLSKLELIDGGKTS